MDRSPKPRFILLVWFVIESFLAFFNVVVAAHFTPGDILIADFDEIGPPAGRIIKVNPRTGAQTLISAAGEFADPFGLALNPQRKLFVADVNVFGDAGNVIRVNPRTGRQKVVSTSQPGKHPFAIAVGAGGDTFVTNVDFVTFVSSVERVKRNGNQKTVTSGGFLLDPVGLAIDQHGKLFVADTRGVGEGGQPGQIIQVDPASGEQTVVALGDLLVDPFGIALDADGDLLVADRNAFGDNALEGPGGVIWIDRKTGRQKVISKGGFFVDPIGIAIDEDGDLMVADRNAFGGKGGVIKVDRQNGKQTLIASGGFFSDPAGVVIVPAKFQAAWDDE